MIKFTIVISRCSTKYALCIYIQYYLIYYENIT